MTPLPKTITNAISDKTLVISHNITISAYDETACTKSTYERLIDASMPNCILTPLITELGKVYANQNDFMITYMKMIFDMTFNYVDSGITCFGFRDLGVDGNGFIFCRMQNPVNMTEKLYHSIFAIKYNIIEREHNIITYKLELHNITDTIKYDPEDDNYI